MCPALRGPAFRRSVPLRPAYSRPMRCRCGGSRRQARRAGFRCRRRGHGCFRWSAAFRRGRWRWCGTVRDYGTTSCLLLRKWCLPAGASRLEPGRNQVGRHLVQVLPMEKPTNRHGRKVGFSSRTGRGQTQCRQSQCHRASRCPTAGVMSWISGHRRLHRRRLRHRRRSRHRRRIRQIHRMTMEPQRKSWN